MVEKARVLTKRYQKSCDVCLAIDSTAQKGVKFVCYKRGYYYEEYDQYVCSDCINGLRDIRKKIYQKIDNPKHDIFKDFMPWLAKELPSILKTKKNK